MSTDPLTGLPTDFVRMLAVKVDPYANNPNKPLDLFFAALMRVQSFRDRHGKFVGTDPDNNNRPEEGRPS